MKLELEQLPEAAFVWDARGYLVSANKAAFCLFNGESKDKVHFRDVFEYSYEELLDQGTPTYMKVRTQPSTWVCTQSSRVGEHWLLCARACPSNVSVEATLDRLQEAFLVVDESGVIKSCNPALLELFGYQLDELLGSKVEILLPEEQRERHVHFRSEFWHEPSSRAMGAGRQLRGRKKNGSTFPVVISLSQMLTEEKPGVLAVIRKPEVVAELWGLGEQNELLRSLREFEARMVQAQKLESLGVLAGGLAHDFNNLLVGILGNAGLAKLALEGSDSGLEYLSRIESAARRASDLTSQMLAYAGEGKLDRTDISLTSLVKEMVTLLRSSVSPAVALSMQLDDELPTFEGDPTQIRQVVMNLITNASEALGEEGGMVRLTTGQSRLQQDYLRSTLIPETKPGRFAFLEVADTGSGMKPEVLSRMFEPFYTTKFTGRGLGLSACLGIIRAHGGTVVVYSEPGNGTTIRVYFCVDRENEGASKAEAKARDDLGRERSILLVDDDATVRATCSELLTVMGFKVSDVRDGESALKLLEQGNDFQAILLDLTMPGIGGAKTFVEIRRANYHIPVVIMSGYGSTKLLRGLEGRKKPEAFLGKPFDYRSLRETLVTILGP